LEEIPAHEADAEALAVREPVYPVDFSDVRGQEYVKRALEVAAAGGHNVSDMTGFHLFHKLCREIRQSSPILSGDGEALTLGRVDSRAGATP